MELGMDPFVAAICAEPDDDLPRLIYADWLDDRGDPRGEFIRLQLSDRVGQPANAARMAELEKLYGRKWAGPFADWAYMVGFRRGFAEHLVIPADVFIDFADVVFNIAPIRGVSLIGAARKLRKLTRLPALQHLTALHLTGTLIGDSGVAKLSACPHLSNLRTLRLGHCNLTSKAVSHLCDSLSLTNVTQIDIADNTIDGAAIAALANSELPARLERLDLRNNDLKPHEVDKLRQILPDSCSLFTDHRRMPTEDVNGLSCG
jgi:uncharacterized protein (TIGR02996 family)